MKKIIYIIAILISAISQAQQPSTLASDSGYHADPRIQIHDLKNYTSIFFDSLKQGSIEEISAGKFDDQFRPLSPQNAKIKAFNNYWLKFSITAESQIDNWWLTVHADPKLEEYNDLLCYVDVWMTGNANKLEHQRTGVFVPRSQKTVKEDPAISRILFSANAGETKHVYIKIYNEFEIEGTVALLQLRDPVAKFIAPRHHWILFASGGVFFFAVMSLIFYFFIREKAYLFFSFYAITLSQHYLILHPDIPFIDLYIREHPDLVMPAFHILTIGGFILFAIFGRYFINLQQLSPRTDKIFKWVIGIWILLLVTTLTLLMIMRRPVLMEAHLVFILAFLIFIARISFFKTLLVRVYVAGAFWLILFTILGMFGDMIFGELPFNPWPIGQVGQILIYAAGLAYKVRMNEKARAQADLIRLRNVELASLYEQSNQQKQEIEIQKKNVEESLAELKAAQTQLIQNEKMASLGELTAGIAHEIKNPLNFVNNFSEVNTELIDEMKEEVAKGNLEAVKNIADNIKDNQEKITYHGKRADDIVKSMLQHSRSSSGVKEQTDINALTDEYLRLSYHGLRAKDKSFNATMKTDYDSSIGTINIMPQEIGRVILNLLTNAFYAVNEKKKQAGEGYEPTVTVTTKARRTTAGTTGAIISIRDNGNGIPKKLLDKIFQPFFTTKPTGQGTGLGLSLSYDIVKAHGGEISLDTKEGEYTEFVISL